MKIHLQPTRLLLILGIGLLPLPLIVAYALRLEHLSYANESLAYRYFYLLRIQMGEGGIWFAQGFTLSAIQHAIHFAIGSQSVNATTLRSSLLAFGYATNLVIVIAQISVLLIAVWRRQLLGSDRVALLAVLVVPMFGTGIVGLYYHLLPDYYSLNVALNAAALLAFLIGLRRGDVPCTLKELIAIGVLAGSMVANKVSMAPVAVMMALPWILTEGISASRILRRTLVVGVSSILSLVLIVLALYLFDMDAMKGALRAWYRFVSNPGIEPKFWQSIRSSLRAYNYDAIVAIAMSMGLVALAFWHRQGPRRLKEWLCVGGALIVLVAWCVFVYRRPANTTLYEGTNAILIVGYALSALPKQGSVRRIIVGLATTAYAVLVIATFPLTQHLGVISASKSAADSRWEFFDAVRARAGSRDVVVLLPTNEYGHGGVHELLLKGMSTPPTWEVGASARHILRALGMPYSFRHAYSGFESFDKAFSPNSYILWFDKPGSTEIQNRIEPVKELLARGAKPFRWQLPGSVIIPAMDAYGIAVPSASR